MAISFEQPGPYDQGTSEAYGRLQQQLANRQAGGGQGGGGGGFGPGAGYGGGGGGGRDTYNGGQDFQGQVEARLAVNQGALSQAEDMRMQRMTQGLSSIQEQLENGEIDEDMANDLTFEVKNNLQPLQYRQAQNQQQIQQQQIQSLQNSNAMQTATMHQNKVFSARGVNERMVTNFNPEVMARLRDQIPRSAYDSDEEHQQAMQQEATRQGGSIQMLETQPGVFVPVQYPGQTEGGAQGGSRSTGTRSQGEQSPNIAAFETRALALVRAANPELTGQPFLDAVQTQVDRLMGQHQTAQAARQPAAPPLSQVQQRVQLHNDTRTFQTQLDSITRTNPELTSAVFDLHQALDRPHGANWSEVANLLSSLPADVRSRPNFLPASMLAKIQAAGPAQRQPASPQEGTNGTPQQVIPVASQAPSGPPNPAMSTLGNMMNRGAGTPATEPNLTPADQPPTMHSLLSDLESARSSRGSGPGLSALSRNFPNAAIDSVRQEHRALAEHRAASESYNDVMRVIREGNGELTDAQKATIREKMNRLPAPIQERLRRYIENPQRGQAPASQAYQPGSRYYQ